MCALEPRQAGSWISSAKTMGPAFSKQRGSSGGRGDLDAAVPDARRALPVAKARGEPAKQRVNRVRGQSLGAFLEETGVEHPLGPPSPLPILPVPSYLRP